MPRRPRLTAVELLRALRRDGWVEHHQRGSHLFLNHPAKPGLVVVPVHSGRIIPPGTLQNILNQAGLTTDDLRDLL